MKKNILSKLLFLCALAFSSNANILALGDGEYNNNISGYEIDSTGVSWFGDDVAKKDVYAENIVGNNSSENSGNNSVFADQDKVGESDLAELNNLDSSGDQKLNTSKKIAIKALKVATIAGVVVVASYVGYKFIKSKLYKK